MGPERKKRLLESCIKGAKEYSNLVGNIYEIHTVENKVYHIEFNTKDFKHLCGVTSSLKDEDFYNNAKKSLLTTKNISNNQIKDWNSLKGKEKCILNIQSFIMNADEVLILEELNTNTSVFPIALRNDAKDIAVAFKKASNYYARSLRKARHSLDVQSASEIDEIYVMKKNLLCVKKRIYKRKSN